MTNSEFRTPSPLSPALDVVREPASLRGRGTQRAPGGEGASNRRHSGTAIVAGAILALYTSLYAQSAEPLTVDEQAGVPTPLEEQPVENLSELAGRVVSGMRDAEARLAGGRLDEETGRLQERINADLARLLAALEEQASQPTPVPGEDSPEQAPGQGPSESGGAGDRGAPGGDSTEGESVEGDRPGELTESELTRRRNLASSVWGHLPEKERDEMLGAFSERFLPAYDELVRQYYESLATRKGTGEREEGGP